MSPARARTNHDEVVAAGLELLEAGGVDAVTMLAVGKRVGVKAPSLYKRFPSRNALLAAISSSTLDDLGRELEPYGLDPDPASGMRAIAHGLRRFAHAHPRAYELLFANVPAEARVSAEQNARTVAPLITLAERLVGTTHALEAARLLTAFTHGFISMELAGAFRLGGDVDAAFRYGVDKLVGSLAKRSAPTGRSATLTRAAIPSSRSS